MGLIKEEKEYMLELAHAYANDQKITLAEAFGALYEECMEAHTTLMSNLRSEYEARLAVQMNARDYYKNALNKTRELLDAAIGDFNHEKQKVTDIKRRLEIATSTEQHTNITSLYAANKDLNEQLIEAKETIEEMEEVIADTKADVVQKITENDELRARIKTALWPELADEELEAEENETCNEQCGCCPD